MLWSALGASPTGLSGVNICVAARLILKVPDGLLWVCSMLAPLVPVLLGLICEPLRCGLVPAPPLSDTLGICFSLETRGCSDVLAVDSAALWVSAHSAYKTLERYIYP
jgi:hypothetical protein